MKGPRQYSRCYFFLLTFRLRIIVLWAKTLCNNFFLYGSALHDSVLQALVVQKFYSGNCSPLPPPPPSPLQNKYWSGYCINFVFSLVHPACKEGQSGSLGLVNLQSGYYCIPSSASEFCGLIFEATNFTEVLREMKI